ncbi:hypothetical protein GE09DRAFT_66730 [Coniochaeta sp. 2T2.1]|nr:hypothetical protein GE09DRAFT_66730 [Coniochaeta sp. 2T2.1]
MSYNIKVLPRRCVPFFDCGQVQPVPLMAYAAERGIEVGRRTVRDLILDIVMWEFGLALDHRLRHPLGLRLDMPTPELMASEACRLHGEETKCREVLALIYMCEELELLDDLQELEEKLAKEKQYAALQDAFAITAVSGEGQPTNHRTTATQALAQTFPGGYELVLTSSKDLLCGLEAIRASIWYQMPGLDVPSVSALQSLITTNTDPECPVVHGVTNNFFVDQLGLALYAWGKPLGLNLQLGCVFSDELPFLISTPGDSSSVLWIHTTAASFDLHDTINYYYYEGMRPTEPLDAPDRDTEHVPGPMQETHTTNNDVAQSCSPSPSAF